MQWAGDATCRGRLRMPRGSAIHPTLPKRLIEVANRNAVDIYQAVHILHVLRL